MRRLLSFEAISVILIRILLDQVQRGTDRVAQFRNTKRFLRHFSLTVSYNLQPTDVVISKKD